MNLKVFIQICTSNIVVSMLSKCYYLHFSVYEMWIPVITNEITLSLPVLSSPAPSIKMVLSSKRKTVHSSLLLHHQWHNPNRRSDQELQMDAVASGDDQHLITSVTDKSTNTLVSAHSPGLQSHATARYPLQPALPSPNLSKCRLTHKTVSDQTVCWQG